METAFFFYLPVNVFIFLFEWTLKFMIINFFIFLSGLS